MHESQTPQTPVPDVNGIGALSPSEKAAQIQAKTNSSNEEDISISQASKTSVDSKQPSNTNGSTNQKDSQNTNENVDENKIKIQKMLKAGFSVKEICKAVGVSTAYVYKIKKEKPVPPKKEKATEQVGLVTQQEAIQNRKEEFLLALFETCGLILDACNKIDVLYGTYYHWCKTDAVFARRVEEVRESMVDFVEGKLLNLIKTNDSKATMFFMKTKGRHRGYSENLEISGPGQGPVQVRVIEPFVDPFAEIEDESSAVEAEYQVIEP